MFDVAKIKLVIWDLDDTFWSGTLSEGPVNPIQENVKLVKDLTDRGVVNAICSKNDFEPAVRQLEVFGVDDFFVFNSIDWTPKGQRVSGLIKEMGLRPVNCLFLDDNIVNLNEAKFYSKDLMVAEPAEIEKLIDFCNNAPMSDPNHKRLNQYKVLEKKQKAKAELGDNLEFLYSSNTTVEIHRDCKEQADRLFELVNRTNQLNFTKYRCTKAELDEILDDEDANCGYVTVKDNFGDYGIVGFYAVKDNRCVHFLFSCRAIGQGVEQWVYSTLGWPELDIVGEVVNEVKKVPAPEWINQQKNSVESNGKRNKQIKGKIVFKGPCDLELLAAFLDSYNIVREFSYVGKNQNSIEHHNHSLFYTAIPDFDEARKTLFLNDCIFNDERMFDTQMYDKDTSLVFLSTLIEANLGVYRRKSDGFKFAFGEWCYPLTDESCWPALMNGEIENYSNKFTRGWLTDFKDKYEYLGRISPVEVVENLKTVLRLIAPQCKICLILGSETPYENNKSKAYIDREKYHKEINALIREFSAQNDRVLILDFNDYIKNQTDFMNNINHFQRKLYYEASKQVVDIISQVTGEKVKEKGKIILLRLSLKAIMMESLAKYPPLNNFLVKLVRKLRSISKV